MFYLYFFKEILNIIKKYKFNNKIFDIEMIYNINNK